MSAAAGDPGIVYILHLDPPYRHARHYTGHAEPGHLAERLAEHGTARGARLLQVQREAGGSWHLARTLPGGRDLERAIKDAQAVPRYCPDCTPTPRQSPPDVTPRRQRLAARAAAPADPAPAVPLPRLPASTCASAVSLLAPDTPWRSRYRATDLGLIPNTWYPAATSAVTHRPRGGAVPTHTTPISSATTPSCAPIIG